MKVRSQAYSYSFVLLSSWLVATQVATLLPCRALATTGVTSQVTSQSPTQEVSRAKRHFRASAVSRTAVHPPTTVVTPPETFDAGPGSSIYNDANAIADRLKDVSFDFDRARLESVTDARQFLQSFPDYYFKLLKENQSSLNSLASATRYNAWCTGGAAPEDFGALIRGDAASIFTVTDVTRAGPCPIEMDFFELLIGSRFVDAASRVDLLVQSYLLGINGASFETPHAVIDLLTRSQRGGMLPDADQVSVGKILREPGVRELTSRQRAAIQSSLDLFFPRKITIVDAVLTRGNPDLSSAGGLSYELVVENRNQLLDIELIQESLPASNPVAASDLPALADRMTTVFTIERGGASIYEGAVTINGRAYVIRPHFNGDLAVVINKEDPDEARDLLRYEAFILGQLHAKTLNEPGAYSVALRSVSPQLLARDTTAMMIFLQRKFAREMIPSPLTSPVTPAAPAALAVSSNASPPMAPVSSEKVAQSTLDSYASGRSKP